jgi:hypothetical protein
MSLTVNCCEGFSIKKLFCNCGGHKEKKKDKEQVLYTDSVKQIVILSTPQVEFPDLLVYEDIKNTDIAVFSSDDDGAIRFSSVQGMNMFRSVQEAQEDQEHSEIKNPEDVAGQRMEDVLPDYMIRFLMPIYQQTLQGNYLQLTTMWMNATHLFRTFPIFNHRKQVIAGMAITSPFNNDFNGDINRFSLNVRDEKAAQKQRKSRRSAAPARAITQGPRPQLMDNTHSGMLQSSIIPNSSPNDSRRPSQAPTDSGHTSTS